MATAITTYAAPATTARPVAPATETGFLHDLAEDIRTTGVQMQGKVHSTFFDKHLLAIANCYLALIVLLVAIMVPFLYLVNYRW